MVFDSDAIHVGHFGFARSELFHELWGNCFGMDVLDSSTIFGPLVVSHVGYDIAKDSCGVAPINFLKEENETQRDIL